MSIRSIKIIKICIRIFALCFLIASFISSSYAQYTNRYPLLDGFRQQIYIEAFDLPIYSSKPICYSRSNKSDVYAYCKNGFIFIHQPNKKLYQVPNSGCIDFQPKWNKDGSKIVFTRDDGQKTYIMIFDLPSLKQTVFYSSGKMDLDSSFSYDDKSILFSSSRNGTFDLFMKPIAGEGLTQITNFPTCELSPVPINNDTIAYVSKTQFGDDEISLYSIKEKKKSILKQLKFLGVCKIDIANNKYVIYSWSEGDTYSLKIIPISNPQFEFSIANTDKENFIYPNFCNSDDCVYYNVMSADSITIRKSKIWSKYSMTVALSIDNQGHNEVFSFKNYNSAKDSLDTFRVSIKDENNHYYCPDDIINVWSDPNTGKTYFYATGGFKLKVPPFKKLLITYSHGPDFFSSNYESTKMPSKSVVQLPYKFSWDATYLGHQFYSGDNHFHLNIEGIYYLTLKHIRTIMAGEGMQFASPLVANFGARITDLAYVGYNDKRIVFGQEVRSHFHGHLSLIGCGKIFYPQFWGPFYELYNDLDISNKMPINHGYIFGALPTYVHPCFTSNPFDRLSIEKNTYDIYQNAINNTKTGIEVADVWSDELGAEKIYEALLNTNCDIFLNAGTDGFPNSFRSPPLGTTRIFTQSKKQNYAYRDFLSDIAYGKSFVTNGPILLFSIQDSLPGAILTRSDSLSFSTRIFSQCDTITFEIISNSNVVFTKQIVSLSKFYTMSGKIKCPNNGWISARIVSRQKPLLYSDSYSFALSSPIWINKKNKVPRSVSFVNAIQVIDILEKNKLTVNKAYSNKAQFQVSEIDKAINILKSLISR